MRSSCRHNRVRQNAATLRNLSSVTPSPKHLVPTQYHMARELYRLRLMTGRSGKGTRSDGKTDGDSLLFHAGQWRNENLDWLLDGQRYHRRAFHVSNFRHQLAELISR